MKKLLIILAVVLTNVFNGFATPVSMSNMKINEAITYSIDINKNFKNFNDSIKTIDNINFAPIYRFLQLKDNQYEEFYNIHKDVVNSLDYLKNNEIKGAHIFKKHMDVDLRNSYYILNKDQYRMYLRVLNMTLTNRDLTKYLE